MDKKASIVARKKSAKYLQWGHGPTMHTRKKHLLAQQKTEFFESQSTDVTLSKHGKKRRKKKTHNSNVTKHTRMQPECSSMLNHVSSLCYQGAIIRRRSGRIQHLRRRELVQANKGTPNPLLLEAHSSSPRPTLHPESARMPFRCSEFEP
jgi:hypothetical protein